MLRKGTLLFAILFCLSSSAFAEDAKTPDQSPAVQTAKTQGQATTEPVQPTVKHDDGGDVLVAPPDRIYSFPPESITLRGWSGLAPPADAPAADNNPAPDNKAGPEE